MESEDTVKKCLSPGLDRTRESYSNRTKEHRTDWFCQPPKTRLQNKDIVKFDD